MKGNGKEGLSRNFAWMKCEGETEERNSVTVWTYSMPIIDVGQESEAKGSFVTPNWREVVREICGAGISSGAIADIVFLETGVRQTSASFRMMKRWQDGQQPGYAVGSALLNLHREVCGGDYPTIRKLG